MQSTELAILDSTGRPFDVPTTNELTIADAEAVLKSFGWASYMSALSALSLPSTQRAQDPYKNHPWVYAAASAIAFNASHVEFEVLRETQDRVTLRKTLRDGWYPESGTFARGKYRAAIRRHLAWRGRLNGVRVRGLEPDPGNPLQVVLDNPSLPIINRSQLWFVTNLWMSIRGEAFWLTLSADGEPVPYVSGDVEQIWPVAPDLIRERVVNNHFVGWQMSTSYASGFTIPKNIIDLDPDELIHFKIPNPSNPLRGMSPITAIAADVNYDMLSVRHNSSVIVNGADPGGILQYDGLGSGFKDPKEKEAFREQWNQRHGGEGNERKTALLSGGWKYVPVGLTPRDMEFLEGRKWSREEILAVMGVPKSVLAVTDGLNYATQISQDRNFWDKRLIPLLKMYEMTLDSTLFFAEPDNVMGAFDLSAVDALRVGLQDKVNTVNVLTGVNIHMPPATAFEVVGMDVPQYADDDIATPGPVTAPANEDDANVSLPGSAKPDDPKGERAPAAHVKAKTKAAGNKMLWADIIRKVQAPYEAKFRTSWRGWVASEKKLQLDAYDKYVRRFKSIVSRVTDVDPAQVLIDITGMRNRIKTKMRPLYEAELNSVYDYTVNEIGGVPVFELDSPDITAVLDAREQILAGTAPETIQNAVRESIRAGIEDGETVSELRDRVARVYDISSSSGKALQVARTESSGFMSEAREAMFDAQGFDEREWVTAGDEHVRENHQTFGASGPHPSDFNYLTLVADEGSLTYPHDPEAPAGEVINCRCVHVPA